jgi:hypothetical protein
MDWLSLPSCSSPSSEPNSDQSAPSAANFLVAFLARDTVAVLFRALRQHPMLGCSASGTSLGLPSNLCATARTKRGHPVSPVVSLKQWMTHMPRRIRSRRNQKSGAPHLTGMCDHVDSPTAPCVSDQRKRTQRNAPKAQSPVRQAPQLPGTASPR